MTCNAIGLVLYLAGGWRSYKEIGEEFGWTVQCDNYCKTAARNVLALEQAGLPIEWDRTITPCRMHLPTDWVERTPWLRRYIASINKSATRANLTVLADQRI